ncbi:MAG: dTDP-4-dehydrorhamnose 3,5-epimerase [Alistipes sp.]|jgi:dTDP-4-dehydrorhamnose 3,5-epimerase|nr:dTDP-4-dehydrorhamnose 3,5-epimerase [Alistipes sp.]
MNIIKTTLEGVLIIEPTVFGDERGYFYESFNAKRFQEQTGIEVNFIQDNESKSKYGVVRGLHFQSGEYAQAKLVHVAKGRILDIAVDIREKSPTFGQYIAVELSDVNHRQLFIPRGFAHGFSVLSEDAVFQYKCDNYYNPQSERGILWSDPSIGIDWQLPASDIILSEKDKKHPLLKDLCESL